MTDPKERRLHPRVPSVVRILWSVIGTGDLQLDRLRDVSASGALVATDAVAKIGEEIRFDLLDENGGNIATGLARVVRVVPARGMGITFLALGIERELVRSLAADGGPMLPPALPGKVGGPPPMPGEHIIAAAAAAEMEAARAEATTTARTPTTEPPESEEIAPEIEPLPMRRHGIVIGIDLGTTNTCASYVVDGHPRIIPGRTGTNTIPSMVTFDADGKHHVGQRAADRQVLQPLRTVYGSKRLLGRTFSASVAAELQRHFAYPLGEAEGQRFGIRLERGVVSMDRIATLILDEVRNSAEAHLGKPVEAAVITVPAYFSEVQREAVRRAAAEANLIVHRIVNEPTAAAVAYGHKQGQRARVAVWDFGGGTFDFSVVAVDERRFEVIATGGDNFIGGSDFDDIVASYLLGEFERESGVGVDPEPQQIARLREAAELAKRALSVQTEYTVEIPQLLRSPKRDLRVEITRAKFDELTRPLVERTIEIASDVMKGAGIGPADIDDVVLVGGSTRIPSVQRAVAQLFSKAPSRRINPDEAVALGAALVADEIGAPGASTLVDVLPMSVGRGVHGLRFEPIVGRNTRLPVERELVLDADLLGAAAAPLFQGDSIDVRLNEYLCSAVVEDASLRDRGRVALRLAFDEHCVMSVEARNAKTGRALRVALDRSRPLEEILRDLGTANQRAPEPARWKHPVSKLGTVFGKLIGFFGR